LLEGSGGCRFLFAKNLKSLTKGGVNHESGRRSEGKGREG
jgi:hypothetical protein